MKFKISVLVFVLTIILSIIVKAEWWIFLSAVLAFLLLTFFGVANVRWNWFLNSLNFKKSSSNRVIALTFDDGPTEFTPKFLEVLDNFDQKGTFFCIGKQAAQYPSILRQIISKGHEVGNHTYSHTHKTGFLSTQQMVGEITKNDEILYKIGGISTVLYRPPFGITNPNIAKAIAITSKKSIGWNIRSFDTALNDESKILKRILPTIKPGSVILLHDTSEKSLNILKQILLFLQQENYRSVTVSDLFKP